MHRSGNNVRVTAEGSDARINLDGARERRLHSEGRDDGSVRGETRAQLFAHQQRDILVVVMEIRRSQHHALIIVD